MRKFVISDIHGCFSTFNEVLNTIGLTTGDELLLLGDYINRGPKSKEVVDEIIKLQSEGYNVTALKGNHEEMIFDSIALEDWNGGTEETLLSFGISHLKELDRKYLNWFSKLKPIWSVEEFIFVHAGLNFTTSNPLQDIHSMCWIRNWHDTIDFNWLGNRKIIHGHVPSSRLEIEKMFENFDRSRVLNIDNGCYMKGENGFGGLCCVELNQMELIFQKNIN
jgi:serine/threonine protein phosphatase 1